MISNFDMKLTQKQAQKYKKAAKKEKEEIISRYCELTGVSRNLASKRFRKVIRNPYSRTLKVKKKSKKNGRKPKYTDLHKVVLKKVWQLSGEICGERLYPVVGDYIKQLRGNAKLAGVNEEVLAETRAVSERTLKRIITEFPKTKSYRKKRAI